MKEISFIHAADIHLGSSLNVGGKYNEQISSYIENAVYSAFARICDQAINKEVDFVILAGDVFDQESRSVKANMFFSQQCQRLYRANIPVYMICGNHDPFAAYTNLLDMPENVYLFSAGQASIEKVHDRDGDLIAAVSGSSYKNRAESRKLHLEYASIPGVWNIGILHTQLERDNKNYLPSTLKELLDIDSVHYWALGHIHSFNVLHKSRNRAVVYPGIPQGRDMGEEGLGGAVLVNLIPDLEPEISFLNLSPVIFQKIEIPIDSIRKGNISDLENLITDISIELLDNYFHLGIDNNKEIYGFIVDWVLTGRGEISNLLKDGKDEIIPFLTENLRKKLVKSIPFIWTRKIYNRTGSPIDEYVIQNNPVFNDIDKVTMLLKENSCFQEELLEELGSIWTNSRDHEKIDYTKFELTEELLKVILEQARQKILEELLARRDLS